MAVATLRRIAAILGSPVALGHHALNLAKCVERIAGQSLAAEVGLWHPSSPAYNRRCIQECRLWTKMTMEGHA
jgi:hypothetical protein